MCAVGAAIEPTASKRLAFGMSFKAFVMISLCKTSVFSSKILMLILLSHGSLLLADGHLQLSCRKHKSSLPLVSVLTVTPSSLHCLVLSKSGMGGVFSLNWTRSF